MGPTNGASPEGDSRAARQVAPPAGAARVPALAGDEDCVVGPSDSGFSENRLAPLERPPPPSLAAKRPSVPWLPSLSALGKCFGDDYGDEEEDWTRAPPASAAEVEKAIKDAIDALARNEEVQLDFSCKHLGDVFGRKLGEAMCSNTSLRLLQLDHNLLGDASVEALALALRHADSSLQTLELDYNQIGDRGARALGVSLQVNSCLRELHLLNNFIGPIGAKKLAEALSLNTTLRSLSLAGNRVGDIGAQAFAAALRTNHDLAMLSLSNNGIGDKGACSLAEAIEEGSRLKELSVGQNQITHEGAEAFARALTTNPKLLELALNDNLIGDRGCWHLSEALVNNHTLKELWLVHNAVSAQGVEYFAQPLEENDALDRLGCSLDKPDRKRKAPIPDGLGPLQRSHFVRMMVKDIEEGGEEVKIDGYDLGDRGVQRLSKAIANSASLKELNLKKCHIQDDGAYVLAESIEKCRSLNQLSLANNEIGDLGARRLARALERNTTLAKIDLEGNPIGDEVAASIATPRLATPRRMGNYFTHGVAEDATPSTVDAGRERGGPREGARSRAGSGTDFNALAPGGDAPADDPQDLESHLSHFDIDDLVDQMPRSVQASPRPAEPTAASPRPAIPAQEAVEASAQGAAGTNLSHLLENGVAWTGHLDAPVADDEVPQDPRLGNQQGLAEALPGERWAAAVTDSDEDDDEIVVDLDEAAENLDFAHVAHDGAADDSDVDSTISM
eukprot:CAMPEP_0170261976 /NCGR_PEP_ID=MMETSP0116_2-20130129/30870_1 /TAXON_ID=400756 /ORGANISM="Durinskia baltica, Strain CSIRO CS-38" /LENGTH=732 /DNA_ID=CAMNT_0010513043 /DNA_START=1 /DNA_END=2199 /DNA_ORIENTATION=+